MLLKLFVLAAFAAVVPAAEDATRNLYGEIAFRGASTFLTYVDKAKMSKMLKDPSENLTVLVPTNNAFANLPPSVVQQLDTNADFLKDVVGFHLVPGGQYLAGSVVMEMLDGRAARAVLYSDLSLTVVSGSPVLLANNSATNGLVHVMRQVMYPLPGGSALDLIGNDPGYSMFYLALTKAGVTSYLEADDITLLALPNEAFQRLPPGMFSNLLDDLPLLTKVIQTHLVSRVIYSFYVIQNQGALLSSQSGEPLNMTVTGQDGEVMHVNGASVTSRDINVSNGVVYVISDVILPANMSDDVNKFFRAVS